MTTTIKPAQPSLGQWLTQARQRLAEHEPDAALEARVLACHVLGQTSAWVQTHPEQPLTRGANPGPWNPCWLAWKKTCRCLI